MKTYVNGVICMRNGNMISVGYQCVINCNNNVIIIV